ncbi:MULTISPECIES: caspase family protein [Cyanophyceae]|uniref:caspase family protein n=1 Tax=Cyanophyceae TaxID=3028117 RepID=UPI0016877132|nr:MULTISPECIES: caspase family protein [Cyanophyceae]MBD1917706.1 caspase family protein [Phormidium sp. FACHB-77]MBD2032804.1 caspase family protein [Phormidium sp. FACHB-322]MBD2053133.1 caspase family protein [Leptolyngbya sp. FACHB-60]
MAKFALLIGISTYSSGLPLLPAAVRDVQALQSVLEHPDMGNFDQVQTILDQDVQAIRRSIEDHFLQCGRDDLALLFFSGHGIKDDFGRLYLAAKETSKDKHGNLIRSTSVETSFIQETMARSRSRHKVVILDCCFSGAFGEGFLAKDDGLIDIENQLGGEGVAVLTSSASMQYSFEHEDSETSIYTRYLVEGIETGAADLDGDGLISSQELHNYTARRVTEAAPAMRPKFFVFEEGFRIYLAQAPTKDPILQYRREVERAARFNSESGEISEIAHRTLALMRENLGISRDSADRIAYEVLEPYRKKKQSLQDYEQTLSAVLCEEYPLSKRSELELKRLQNISGLQDEDVEPIRSRLIAEKEVSGFLAPLNEENQDDNVDLNHFTDSQLPVVKSDFPESPSLTQALPLPALFVREGLGNEPERFSFTVSLIALGAFITTVVSGVFAYQYLWRGELREPVIALAFQSASFPPTVGEFINALEIYVLNREGESSGHRAWRLYTEAGNIEGAIEELRKVDPASSEYADAQERLAEWPRAFKENEQNFELSQKALIHSNLIAAENYAKALDSTQPFWQNRQKELLNRISEERARIARLSHQQICGARNSGTTLSRFRDDAQGKPVLDEYGEFELIEDYYLSKGTEVALTSSPASSEMSNLALSFVEVKEGPSLGKRGWVDSRDLCDLSD